MLNIERRYIPKGNFTIKTKKMKKGTRITVWAKSKNGIKSKVTKYKVK